MSRVNDSTIETRNTSRLSADLSQAQSLIVVCLVLDVIAIAALWAFSFGPDTNVIFAALVIAVFCAQATMIAIWLGLVVPLLYCALLIVLGMPLFVSMYSGRYPLGFIGAAIVFVPLLYPLPYALLAACGLRFRRLALAESEPPTLQLSIRSLLYWTLVLGAALGTLRLIPIRFSDYPEVWFWFALGTVSGVVTVLILLRPGHGWWSLGVLLAALVMFVLIAGRHFELSKNNRFYCLLATFHVLLLIWFLSFYRRAGYRAVWRRGYYPEPERKPVRTPVNPLAD